jgi:hypothetical protein
MEWYLCITSWAVLRFLLVHRDPRYFSPEPEAFWPERWMPEGPKIAEAQGHEFRLSQGAYIPFHYGESPLVLLHAGCMLMISLIRSCELCWSLTRFARGSDCPCNDGPPF